MVKNIFILVWNLKKTTEVTVRHASFYVYVLVLVDCNLIIYIINHVTKDQLNIDKIQDKDNLSTICFGHIRPY